jgi:hypothetical protein
MAKYGLQASFGDAENGMIESEMMTGRAIRRRV